MDNLIKNSVYSYQYDELTSEETNNNNNNIKSAEVLESSKEILTQTSTTAPSQHHPMPEFKLLMVQRKNETADFKNLIITLALVLVSLGLLANLLFNLLVVCRKRKRQTSTTLVMFSMCTAYSIYLCFYCLKLSVYFGGDSITKFHMYDTIDNWAYGSFLCKLVSGLPYCCKLISRLSILTLVLKRLLCLFVCDCAFATRHDSKEASQVDSDDIDSENTKLNEINHTSSSSKSTTRSTSSCGNKLHLVAKSFEWPILISVILFTWIISLGVTFPVFNSYKLNEPTSSFHTNICNSVFRFPEDISHAGRLFFSYTMYGFILPCVLIFISLLALSLLQANSCFRLVKSTPSNEVSSSSSSSSSSSFDDLPNAHCSKFKSHNLLLWIMFAVHLFTTLPQELYKYGQLKIDFNDEANLDTYLTSSLIQPILKARPYYAWQLLYVSEFTLMPLTFLLFYVCSLKRHNRPTRSESDSDLPNKPGSLSESSAYKYLRACFYDPELAKSKESQKYFLHLSQPAVSSKKPPVLMINDESKPASDSKVSTHGDALALYNRENILMNNSCNSSPTSANAFAAKLRPTPFELADQANLVHIIQHPSWRINIKQQPHSPGHESSTTPSPKQHLHQQQPYAYAKTNGFNN